jgi:hypothetical protein
MSASPTPAMPTPERMGGVSPTLSPGPVVPAMRRAVFVSYQHGHDQVHYDAFAKLYSGTYRITRNSALRQRVESADAEAMVRSMQADHLTASSCTIVLCGLATRWRKFVDWEIRATLDEEHGLIGVKLPNLRIEPHDGNRLQDNIDSGYAVWVTWEQLRDGPNVLASFIEDAIARPKDLIRNGRALRLRNGAV